MPFEIKLPKHLSAQGWKVKIREKERVEPPHVSVLRRHQTWRWGLREREFLDKQPPARLVPIELLIVLEAHFDSLVRAWDRKYPENPVYSEA